MISDQIALYLVQLSYIPKIPFQFIKITLSAIIKFYISMIPSSLFLKHWINEIYAMMKEQSEILRAIGRRQGVEDTASNRKSIIEA